MYDVPCLNRKKTMSTNGGKMKGTENVKKKKRCKFLSFFFIGVLGMCTNVSLCVCVRISTE